MHGCLAIPFKISLDRMRVLQTYCKTADSKATTLLMACDMHDKKMLLHAFIFHSEHLRATYTTIQVQTSKGLRFSMTKTHVNSHLKPQYFALLCN
jgi:hypothetical protein